MGRSNRIFGITGLISTIFGFLAKILYRNYITANRIDDYGIAGFLPSYFYVLGFSQLLLIKPSKNPVLVIAIVTIASVGFEFMQYRHSNHIDIQDIIASIIGGITSMIMVKSLEKKV